MDIPKGFRPEKGSDKKLKQILEQKQNERAIKDILSSCDEFLRIIKEEAHGSYPETWYEEVGIVLAESINYTKYDLEALSKRITIGKEQERNVGCYLSALVNKIITEEETITLTFNKKIDYLGLCLQKGKLILRGLTGDNVGHSMKGGKTTVEGNTGNYSGCRMKGGELIIEGNTGSHLGSYMFGGKILLEGRAKDFVGMVMYEGEIIIKGDAGKHLGYSMKKEAKITIDGELKDRSFSYCEGEIYNKGTKIWPR